MSFSDVPIRTNATDIEAGWFNALRSAGIGVEGESATGNIVRNTTITGLVTTVVEESTESPSFIEVEYAFNRDHDDDDTDVLRQRGILRVPYEGTFIAIGEHEYSATQSQTSLGFAPGVTFEFTQNLAGTARTIGMNVLVSDSGALSPTVQGTIKAFMRKVFV